MEQGVYFPSDPAFLANLVIQRTDAFIEIGGGVALKNWLTTGNKQPILDFLFNNNLVTNYLDRVFFEASEEAEKLVKYLNPQSLKRIVSVGVGNGLIELFLLKQGKTEEILLIDIESTEKHTHGFSDTGSGYANLDVTRSFLLKNVNNVKIDICNPTQYSLPKFEYTLFISLLSMGFHFPCHDYMPFILENMGPNSMIVFDRRHEVVDFGADSLMNTFATTHLIRGKKSNRVFLQKKLSAAPYGAFRFGPGC